MVMKYTKYIAILSALLFAACTTELIEPAIEQDGNGMIQLVSRVIPFSDRDVATRANKNETEVKVSSIAYFIFQENGTCIFHERVTTTDPLSIDRSSSELANYDLTECNIISIANAPEFNVTPGETTWDDVASQTVNVSGVAIPSGGLAMIGRYPEDENTFINLNTAAPGEVLTIPMQSLFSKIVVNINVDSDQLIPGENQPLPTFTLKGAEVHNVASAVDFIGGNESGAGLIDGTNDDTAVNTESYFINAFNETSDGGTAVSFSFYLPERFLRAGTSASTFQYPFGKGTAIRAEDMGYRQRYKPLLAKGFDAYNSTYVESKDKKATYVTINGTYSDHQGHSFNVSYDIYVGRDNYGNFDIVRNAQYNNNVTIRGINNSSDQSADNAAVSIDHRVNVERLDPIIVNFRRETLLDSHFEVRPLRVRSSGVNADGINAVKVQVVNHGTTNWMRLERSFGDGTADGSPTNASGQCIYINEDSNSASYGKRRYFTYNLVDGKTPGNYDYSLVNSTEVILPISQNTECCWIYVDECTATGDDVRSGIIRVSYGSYNGTTFTPANSSDYPDLDYVINQRKLFEVTYDDPNTTAVENRTYRIEYEEEYLHNFDADDSYGQTEYEGMEWGLEGVQLSYDHEALYFKAKTGDWANGIVDHFTGDVPAYYDFYIKKHDQSRMADPKQVTLHEYAGYDFCNEIIETVNGVQKDSNGNAYDSDSSNNIEVLQLDAQPKSAIEYCYNKNKRNNVGIVENVEWYLPAVDEIEDIVMSKYGNNLNTYTRFLEFQDQDYWSCQPAFIQNYAHLRWTLLIFPLDYWGAFYFDDIGDSSFDIDNNTDRANIGSARSTSVKYENGVYSSTASGTNGYYSYYDASSKTYQYSGTFNGVTVGTITREDGNFPRDEKNRIRCVRKQASSTNQQ